MKIKSFTIRNASIISSLLLLLLSEFIHGKSKNNFHFTLKSIKYMYINWEKCFFSLKIASDKNGEAPLIIPTVDEFTALPQTIYNFTCQASEPVIWTFEDVNKLLNLHAKNLNNNLNILLFYLSIFLDLEILIISTQFMKLKNQTKIGHTKVHWNCFMLIIHLLDIFIA